MKKLFALLLAVLMIACFAACGGTSQSSASSSASSEETADAVESEDSVSSEEETETEEADFDLDAFESSVSECRTLIDSSVYALQNIVTYQNNYWTSYVNMSGKSPSADTLTEYGLSWIEEKTEGEYSQDILESNNDSIRDYYKEIVLTDVSNGGTAAEKLYDAICDMYDAYDIMYDSVFTPSGTQSSWYSAFSSAYSTYSDCCDTIDLFID